MKNAELLEKIEAKTREFAMATRNRDIASEAFETARRRQNDACGVCSKVSNELEDLHIELLEAIKAEPM